MASRKIKKKTTLKDIAEKTGFSVSTVSQILNNKDNNYCSQKNKDLVFRIAKELNYQPNIGYRIMVGEKTNTVAIVCSNSIRLQESAYRELTLKLIGGLEEKGYASFVVTMCSDGGKNKEKLLELIGRGCSVFIFLGTPVAHNELEQMVVDRELNYISYDSHSFKRRINTNRNMATKKFIRNFIESGFAEFRLIFAPYSDVTENCLKVLYELFPNESPVALRNKYYRPLDKHHLFPKNALKHFYDLGFDMAKSLYKNEPEINAFVCINDYVASGVMGFLKKRGKLLGKDVAVSGYNCIDAFRLGLLPICSASINIDKICNLLIDNCFCDDDLDIACSPQIHIVG